ncbi:hypothetical protein KFK09_002562 [Dendrobium nobile]|uniref:Uncharacterized protein n=1 Tax=Dendrobium nobile TaxID=94219 RepID=A0A8T3C7G4_DENNO|nr:hypothetical protein KFK09_002562 [Dendrobium nobile]
MMPIKKIAEVKLIITTRFSGWRRPVWARKLRKGTWGSCGDGLYKEVDEVVYFILSRWEWSESSTLKEHGK